MRPLHPSFYLAVLALALGALAACDNGASDLTGPDLVAAAPATVPAEAEASFTPGPFRCDQTNPTRWEDYESVTGTINAQGVPTDVLVFRTNIPENQDSYRATAKRVQNYWGPMPAGTVAWNVTGHPPGTSGNSYFLVIPPARYLPPSGGTFDGEMHVYFGPQGQYGWWQTVQACSFL